MPGIIEFELFGEVKPMRNVSLQSLYGYLFREKQAGTGMKGSQMEEEEAKDDKEEKNWRMRPLAFQVSTS